MIHGYIRVSTAEQAGGTSPDDQERRIRMVAEFTNGGEPTIWSDLGVSGGTPLAERPAGAEMLGRIASGDVIVAAKLDRLFRNAENALTQSRAWHEQNIGLILMDMGPEPVTTSAAGRLFFGLLAQFAEFERMRINERTRDGRAAKRAAGGFIGGNAPTGYRAAGRGKDAVLEPNESELNAIACAQHYHRVLGWTSPTKIAHQLNAEGFTSRSGTPLVATQVWRWLRLD